MNRAWKDLTGAGAKILITSAAVLACAVATVILGYFAGESVIYTHFYYVPVVLAAIWYRRNGLIVPFILVAFYFVSVGASENGLGTNDYLRGAAVIVVGIVVGELSNIISTTVLELSSCKERLRNLLKTRTAERDEANAKLALMSRMTRHDLVNDLAVLTGWLELAGESKDMDECRTHLAHAADSGRAMRQAFEFAAEYERIGVQAPVWVNVKDAVSSAFSGFDLVGIEIDNRLPDCEVLADSMLGKVFRNLVDNSLRHGGTIHRISISGDRVGDSLVLTYADDGRGISDKDRPHLFEPGYGKHTGLGMFFAKKVLEMTGMSIEEHGTSGSGVRFVITVPPGKSRSVASPPAGDDRVRTP
jgi:signal transduction histidine kinase